MKITYDAQTDVAYIYVKGEIRAGEASRTVPVPGTDIALDFDSVGRLLGIEVLNARFHGITGVE